MLATIYERLVKAKQLVIQKTEEDIQKHEILELIDMVGDDELT